MTAAPAPCASRRDPRGLAAAVLLHLAGAAVLCADALRHFGQRVPGAADTETWPFLWGWSWMARAVVEQGRLPLRTDLLDFPEGGVLWLKDPVTALVFLPVQLLLGLPEAYTLGVMGVFTLAGVGMFLFLKELGLSRGTALACSPLFAFCPHALGEAYNANLEALHGGVCALWAWALVRSIRAAGRGEGRLPAAGSVLLLAVTLAVLLVTNQYFAWAMAVASPFLAMAALREVPRARRLSALTTVAAGVAGGGILVLPAGLRLYRSLGAEDALTLFDRRVPLVPPYVSDLLEGVRPLSTAGANAPPFQDLVYPGLLVLGLALLAPPLRPREPWAWLGPAGGLFFGLLALGPALYVDGQLVRWGGEPVYLPWAWWVPGTPLVGGMTLPHRMAIPAALFLALGAAWTVEALRRRTGSGPRLSRWPLLLPVAAGAEILLYPPYEVPLTTVQLDRPAFTRFLARHPREGAVLHLPFHLGANRRLRYLWWQHLHRRPVATSLRQGPPPSIAEQVPYLSALVDFQQGGAPPEPASPALADRLRDAGFAFVVLRTDDLAPGGGSVWRDLLRTGLGSGRAFPPHTRVYTLEATPSPGTGLPVTGTEP